MQDNDIEIYLTDNGPKSVVSVRFIRTWRNKIYNYISLISKNMYIDKLDDKNNGYIYIIETLQVSGKVILLRLVSDI